MSDAHFTCAATAAGTGRQNHEHDVRAGWCDRICRSISDPGERTDCTGRLAGTPADLRIQRWRRRCTPAGGSSRISASVKRSPSATMSRSSVFRARDNGHVIVLNLTPTGWKQVQRLTAPNSSTASHFGRVALRRGHAARKRLAAHGPERRVHLRAGLNDRRARAPSESQSLRRHCRRLLRRFHQHDEQVVRLQMGLARQWPSIGT